jgi:HEAT repeat protein
MISCDRRSYPTVTYTDDPRYANSSLAASRATKSGDVEFLLSLLASTDRFGRIGAAQGLGDLRSRRAVDPLVRCLNAADELMRVSALRALASIGERSCVDAILEVGEGDPSFGVRFTAAEALLALNDSRGREVLVQIVRDASRRERSWAIRKLVEIGATEAIPALEGAARTASGLERLRIGNAVRRLRAR